MWGIKYKTKNFGKCKCRKETSKKEWKKPKNVYLLANDEKDRKIKRENPALGGNC